MPTPIPRRSAAGSSKLRARPSTNGSTIVASAAGAAGATVSAARKNDTGFNDTQFLDIVDNARIILSYVMGRELGGERRRDSASLATIELIADGVGTRLIYTEQGAYFGDDGAAHIPRREEGCAKMFDNLAHELETQP